MQYIYEGYKSVFLIQITEMQPGEPHLRPVALLRPTKVY